MLNALNGAGVERLRGGVDITGLIFGLFEMSKTKPRWQFSLRQAFILMTIVAITVAVIADRFQVVVTVSCAVLWLADLVFLVVDLSSERSREIRTSKGTPPPVFVFGTKRNKTSATEVAVKKLSLHSNDDTVASPK